MKKSSSYIFFQSPYYKKKTPKTDENVIVLNTDYIRKSLVEACLTTSKSGSRMGMRPSR